jgi:hypothetical protein
MSASRVVVDRIEADRALLSDGTETIDVPVAWLPVGVREGTVLTFLADSTGTTDALAAAEARLARLRARNADTPTDFDL